MTPVTRKMAEIGLLVQLSPNSIFYRDRYAPNYNPINITGWIIEIKEPNEMGLDTRVEWSNGARNIYNADKDLILAEKIKIKPIRLPKYKENDRT